jgi:hypothetical protein
MLEFLRTHRKIIVAAIAVTVIAWMVGITALLPMLMD